MLPGDFLSEELVIPELKASDRWEAIDELLDLLVQNGRVAEEDRAEIEAVVKKREKSMSTGIGFGIGIPHASTALIEKATGAFGRSTAGVNFDALDNQPVKMIMLFLVPQGQFQKHLHTLADIATLFRDQEFRGKIEAAGSSAEIFSAISESSGE